MLFIPTYTDARSLALCLQRSPLSFSLWISSRRCVVIDLTSVRVHVGLIYIFFGSPLAVPYATAVAATAADRFANGPESRPYSRKAPHTADRPLESKFRPTACPIPPAKAVKVSRTPSRIHKPLASPLFPLEPHPKRPWPRQLPKTS